MSFGYGERVEKTSDLPTPLLFVLGVFASGFVLALNLDAGVLDVGYAGIAGADRILDGISPYGLLTTFFMYPSFGPRDGRGRITICPRRTR